jgi:hypothetical protein
MRALALAHIALKNAALRCGAKTGGRENGQKRAFLTAWVRTARCRI